KSTVTPVSPSKKAPAPARTTKDRSLYSGPIDLTWPTGITIGAGLYNSGNTCFLNSALQCLLHTPPLLQVLLRHNTEGDMCRVKNSFCMACSMRDVMLSSHKRKQHSAFAPYEITNKLTAIAKHMRRGRQEDSHEFLRYAIDALQKSCLAGLPPKLDSKLAETTWVHKIFGGKLRSRVTCHSCKHNSDTFDSILDLSVDIHGQSSLKDALRNFVAIDYLKGADKYKCEKCKQKVVAEKRFTVHEAPMVLTVHLKRFSPLGRKIGHPVRYDERLSLGPYMSKGSYGPSYSLYGVISHAGGGPNSGHYYAYVKSGKGQWYEMNDDSVTRCQGAPLDKKNAYILFYIR
ncbi:cysteine proteinase, partial [Dentipellis sp. KUC8613]